MENIRRAEPCFSFIFLRTPGSGGLDPGVRLTFRTCLKRNAGIGASFGGPISNAA
jgi:hypothetical protein